MSHLGIAGALLCAGCSAAASSAATCEQERHAKETSFAPLRAELEALRAAEAKLGNGKDGYPPLQMAQRYLDLQEKMEAVQRAHPLAACRGANLKAMAPQESSNAEH